jgi:sporulation integral membrane protein YtvI
MQMVGGVAMNNSPWVQPLLRTLTVILIAIVAIYLIRFTLPLIYPFLIGWIIAMLIEPIVRWLEKRVRIPRWVSVTLILLFVLSLILSLVIFIVAEMVMELTHLAEMLPSILSQAREILIDVFTREDTILKRMIDTVQNFLEKNPQHQQRISETIEQNIGLLANKGTQWITAILKGMGAFLGNLPYFLTVSAFITLSAFFIGLDWPRLRFQIKKWIPLRAQQTGGIVVNDLKKALSGFIRAQLILISISAFIMFIGLLVLQVPYAFSIALVVGLTDLLPYVGVSAVAIPWITYLLLKGDMHLGVGVTILFIIIIVVRNLLEPKLVASSVGLDPLLTLIAIFAGLKLFGVLGLILGPVTAVILMTLHRAHVFRDIWRFIHGQSIVP